MENNEERRGRLERDQPRWIEEIDNAAAVQLFQLANPNRVEMDNIEEEEPQEPQYLNRVHVEAPRRHYPLLSGFPIVSTCNFDRLHHQPHEEFASHKGLEWVTKFTTHEESPGLLTGRATIHFSGMGANTYMLSVTCHTNNRVDNGPDNMIVVDKEHCQVVFPMTIVVPNTGGTYSPLVAPQTIITVTVHNIELVNGGVYHEQRWPNGSSWIVSRDLFSVRMNKKKLKKVSICFDRFMADLAAGSFSMEEAQGFYNFACLLFHNAFLGDEKYQETLKVGYKLGFTQLKKLDLPDSPLDFHTRTMFPNYQLLSVETPVEQVSRDGNINGSCGRFKLKLNPHIQQKWSQVERMPNFRGRHKGQMSFYLEQTPQGTLLLAAVNMLLNTPKLAQMKIALFENQHAVQHHETCRIVNSDQRTICIVVCLLTEKQISMMIEGSMAVMVQIHLFPAGHQATHIHNVQTLEDGTVAHVMPGLINGWIRCGDGKLVGVCKEHVAHFCGWLSMMFFNQSFIDCGKSTVDVHFHTDVVLDALQIIYHRCHAVHFDRVDLVLEVAGYWVSPVIRSYFDVAVWRSSLMLIEDKVKLTRKYNLDITSYVLRHPEYHGIVISADLMAELLGDA